MGCSQGSSVGDANIPPSHAQCSPSHSRSYCGGWILHISGSGFFSYLQGKKHQLHQAPALWQSNSHQERPDGIWHHCLPLPCSACTNIWKLLEIQVQVVAVAVINGAVICWIRLTHHQTMLPWFWFFFSVPQGSLWLRLLLPLSSCWTELSPYRDHSMAWGPVPAASVLAQLSPPLTFPRLLRNRSS